MTSRRSFLKTAGVATTAVAWASTASTAWATATRNAPTPPIFSDDEIRAHTEHSTEIAAVAARHLDEVYADHLKFFAKWGVSKYYGNRREDYKTHDGRVRALEAYGKPTSLADMQVAMGCVTLAMECLQIGFAAAGIERIWTKIYDVLSRDNLFLGTDLQILLQQLGWRIIYWNPDPTQNAKWDQEDRLLDPLKPGKKWNPIWGGHEARYRTVKQQNLYAGIHVDDSVALVGFGVNPPAWLRELQFFVGTAHAGYHVFPGRRSEVIEAHSMRPMKDPDNLQVSPFNPLAPGGGPRWTDIEKYRSGMMAVPPIAIIGTNSG